MTENDKLILWRVLQVLYDNKNPVPFGDILEEFTSKGWITPFSVLKQAVSFLVKAEVITSNKQGYKPTGKMLGPVINDIPELPIRYPYLKKEARIYSPDGSSISPFTIEGVVKLQGHIFCNVELKVLPDARSIVRPITPDGELQRDIVLVDSHDPLIALTELRVLIANLPNDFPQETWWLPEASIEMTDGGAYLQYKPASNITCLHDLNQYSIHPEPSKEDNYINSLFQPTKNQHLYGRPFSSN